MKNTPVNLLLALVVSVFSCSTVKVVTDQDTSADLSAYKTYHFLGWQDDSDQFLSDFDKRRIHEAFKKEFDARGLELVQSGGDMTVSLYIVVDPKTSVTSYTDYYTNRFGRYHLYNRGWAQGYAVTTYTEEDYLEGTLVLDVFDGKSNNQVWQGVVTGTIVEDPGKREKTIPKRIAALMKKYPVPKS